MFIRSSRLAIAVLCTALVAAQPAVGTSNHVQVSGSYAVLSSGTVSCAPHGSPFERCRTIGFRSAYSGSLTGTSVSRFEQTINCKTNRTRGHGVETFTGTIQGFGSGTLTWRIHFESALDCTTGATEGFSGRGDVTAGTGDLARVRGTLRFGSDTYQGELHK